MSYMYLHVNKRNRGDAKIEFQLSTNKFKLHRYEPNFEKILAFRDGSLSAVLKSEATVKNETDLKSRFGKGGGRGMNRLNIYELPMKFQRFCKIRRQGHKDTMTKYKLHEADTRA